MVFWSLLLSVYILLSLDTVSALYAFIGASFMVMSFMLSSRWYHVMILLMILEMFMLMLFVSLSLCLSLASFSSGCLFIFITLSVAEASVGMSLLTMMVRSNGNDYMGAVIF
uniref:NADH dehydrogenase subunit 4L n=1 Tax=Calanus sinicus TaxID=114070 RepID=F1ADJ7_CALSV|nr:NADH dehydrogenase subunit 4L [Calanus sinicus]ADT63576.1 NADH dehydrogenase subunit 4L [Calanus sinicus]ADT63590.1 NADH dehydrogenase subunit 4L [Calanus sinicus]ADT63602.1 NADH dehydrogenase subunit 4L [Calanus sinicus]ADT63615.1 NADH dehydrogenase subunit 4L [Calanus sinicus]